MKCNKLLLILLSLSVFSSCKKTDKDEVLGTQLHYASDSFEVVDSISLDKSSVVFSQDGQSPARGWQSNEDSVIFTGKYNEKVTTKITITGLESGAKRILSIDAQELNGTNSSWRGEHQGFDFFRIEKAVVTYEVLGVGEIKTPDTIDIKGPQLYRSGRNFALPSWSFERNHSNPDKQYDPASSDYFQEYGVTTTPRFNISEIVNIPTPNGTSAYKLQSSVDNKNGFLKMGVSFLAADFKAIKRQKFFITNENPDSVYFNIYIYSPTPRVETRLVAVLGETDVPEIEPGALFLAINGEHDRFSHDRKLMEFDMNFTGWKLFSFRYSDIAFATNPFYGGSGNKVNEPHSVSIIDFNLESDFPGIHYVYVDFPIITYGGPFDPTKLN